MKTISAIAAAKVGLVRYFTGKPCRKGHVAERYVKSSQCVPCSAAISSARYRADPVGHMISIRKHRGLPDPTRAVPDVCECCGRPQRAGKQLALDHDHVTGKFRGWLCDECNTSIGKLGDDIAGLEKALAYLKAAV
jgi:hypothetical protein